MGAFMNVPAVLYAKFGPSLCVRETHTVFKSTCVYELSKFLLATVHFVINIYRILIQCAELSQPNIGHLPAST